MNSLLYQCYLNNSVADILNFVRYQRSSHSASYFIRGKINGVFLAL